jgi:dolichyl-phosphate beta-glucosyltransferase
MSNLVIVIPCYNEVLRFPNKDFIDFLKKTSNQIFFCFVNDGSIDTTFEMLEKLQVLYSERIEILNLKQNVGKAEAVRSGINYMYNHQKIKGEYFAFLDADLATPLDELMIIYNKIKSNQKYKLVLGSRWQRLGANIERKVLRHYLGRIFATFASIILKLRVYDTQCGAKILHRTIINVTCKEAFISKWLFDVEILARIINKFGPIDAENILVEVPLNVWYEKGGSKLRLKDLINVPVDLIKIKYKYFS